MPSFLWISSRTACAVHNAKGNCIWSGILFADPALDAPRFNLCQNKLIARAPTALSFLDTGRTVAPECPTPTADRPAMNPDSQRRLHVRRALLNKKNSANTQSFLCPLIQFAGVAKLHQRRLSDLLRHVICLLGILVMSEDLSKIAHGTTLAVTAAITVMPGEAEEPGDEV